MAYNLARAFAAEPEQRPPKAQTGFASPTDAWEAYVKAGETADWMKVYDSCTPTAQDVMAFECLLGLKFGVAWFNLEESDDAELRALAAKCDRVYAAHGIDFKRLEKEAEKAESANLDREDLQKLCLPLIRDKRKFFADATAQMAAVQKAVGEKLGKEMREKPGPEAKADPAPAEAPPPDLGKIVNVKIKGDRATGEIMEPVSGTLIVGGKQVRYQTHPKFFRRLDGRWYIAAENEPVESPLHKIAAADIPYEKQFTLEAGDALRFELPDGKVVAVWCEGGVKNRWAAEQTTASGLKTSWGEQPFKHVRYKRVREPGGGITSGETDSYIKQGGVTTSTRDETSTYQLFVGELEFSIIEDLRAKEKLPVTIRVVKRAEQNRQEPRSRSSDDAPQP